MEPLLGIVHDVKHSDLHSSVRISSLSAGTLLFLLLDFLGTGRKDAACTRRKVKRHEF
jgi:hypothetical protein